MVANPNERPTGQHLLTLDDYLALGEDEYLEREIIRGRLYVTAKPRREHQWLMKRLSAVLDEYVTRRGGDDRQVLPDADLIIDERRTYVSPDLMYFTREALERLLAHPRDWVDAAHVRPLLAVEIVSPGAVARDVVEKLQEYEAIRIPFYWIFGPERRRFREFVLDPADGRYRAIADQDGGQVTPRLFAGEELPLVLDLDRLVP